MIVWRHAVSSSCLPPCHLALTALTCTPRWASVLVPGLRRHRTICSYSCQAVSGGDTREHAGLPSLVLGAHAVGSWNSSVGKETLNMPQWSSWHFFLLLWTKLRAFTLSYNPRTFYHFSLRQNLTKLVSHPDWLECQILLPSFPKELSLQVCTLGEMYVQVCTSCVVLLLVYLLCRCWELTPDPWGC